MIHELRQYRCEPGAEAQVHERFRDTVLPLFTKHDIDVLGMWQSTTSPEEIVCLLAFVDEATQSRKWDEFQSDPWWSRAKAASEVNGPIVASMSSTTLQKVHYWSPRESETSWATQ